MSVTKLTLPNEIQKWYLHDLLHRTDGPAVIFPDGSVFWWFRGRAYNFDTWAKITGVYHTDEYVLLKLKYG